MAENRLDFAPSGCLKSPGNSHAQYLDAGETVPRPQQVRELTYLNTFFMRLVRGKSRGWQLIIGRYHGQWQGGLKNLNQSLHSANNCVKSWRMPSVIYARIETKRVGLGPWLGSGETFALNAQIFGQIICQFCRHPRKTCYITSIATLTGISQQLPTQPHAQ